MFITKGDNSIRKAGYSQMNITISLTLDKAKASSKLHLVFALHCKSCSAWLLILDSVRFINFIKSSKIHLRIPHSVLGSFLNCHRSGIFKDAESSMLRKIIEMSQINFS